MRTRSRSGRVPWRDRLGTALYSILHGQSQQCGRSAPGTYRHCNESAASVAAASAAATVDRSSQRHDGSIARLRRDACRRGDALSGAVTGCPSACESDSSARPPQKRRYEDLALVTTCARVLSTTVSVLTAAATRIISTGRIAGDIGGQGTGLSGDTGPLNALSADIRNASSRTSSVAATREKIHPLKAIC